MNNNDTKYYDLSPSQSTLFFAQKFCLFKSLNTVCTSYFLEMEFDFDKLREAIVIGYRKHEALHIRLAKVGGKTVQYISDDADVDVKILDFRGKTKQAQEKAILKIAKKNLTKLNVPLSSIYMVHTYDNFNGLLLAVSHLAMDSFAIFAFYQYVLKTYLSMTNGTLAPKDPAAYIPQLQAELNYPKTESYQKDIEYWNEQLQVPAPVYTDFYSTEKLKKERRKRKDPQFKYVTTYSLDARAAHEVLAIPADYVSRAEKYCKENRISMQSFILTVYGMLLADINKTDDVSVVSVNARRATLAEKTCGGSRVHFHFFRQYLPDEAVFRETVKQCFADQCVMLKHINIDPLEIVTMYCKEYNLPQTCSFYAYSLTFQPINIAPPDGVRIQSKWYNNGAASQPLYITMMDGDATGAIYVYYQYLKHAYTKEQIRSSHEKMMRFFDAALDDDTRTLGELMKY